MKVRVTVCTSSDWALLVTSPVQPICKEFKKSNSFKEVTINILTIFLIRELSFIWWRNPQINKWSKSFIRNIINSSQRKKKQHQHLWWSFASISCTSQFKKEEFARMTEFYLYKPLQEEKIFHSFLTQKHAPTSCYRQDILRYWTEINPPHLIIQCRTKNCSYVKKLDKPLLWESMGEYY